MSDELHSLESVEISLPRKDWDELLEAAELGSHEVEDTEDRKHIWNLIHTIDDLVNP